MGFFSDIFNKSDSNTCDPTDTFECGMFEQELVYKRLALEITIDLIANSFARADWKTFVKNEQVEKTLFYKLNVAPNEYQTSTEFFKQLVRRIMLDGDVLIYPNNGNLYVADSFTKYQESFNKVTFNTITINNHILKKGATTTILNQDQVIYMNYNDVNIKSFMDSYARSYNALLESAVYGYQSNKTRRFTLDSKLFRSQSNEAQEQFNNLMAQNLADFASSKAGAKIYAKSNDWQIENVSDKQIESSNDSRRFIRDMFDIVANTYHVPIQMIMTSWEGTEVTQNVIDNYLVNAVYPMIDLFKEAINRYNYSESEYLRGDRVQPDVTKVRVTDLKTIGTFIAQVFPTGALSLNDIITNYLHLDKLPDELGDTRVITKNYQKIDDFQNGVSTEETLEPQIEETTIIEDKETNNNGN